MSFGRPGHYGKFFINSKETPVSNDLNYTGSVKLESKTLQGHQACPSPWLKGPEASQPGVYPCIKEHTEFPIQHPHAGGVRWHNTMHSNNSEMEWDPKRLFMEVGDQLSVCAITKPIKMGYGDSFGIVFDVEFTDPERGHFALGVALQSAQWDQGELCTIGGGKCMVQYDGSCLTADRDGSEPYSWDRSQCCPLLALGGLHSSPPLVLQRPPKPSAVTKMTPSPARPPHVRQHFLQDGSRPMGGRGRLILSVSPSKNALYVQGNEFEVKIPNMHLPQGEPVFPVVEARCAKVALVRVHDGSSLAELYQTNNPVKSIVNNDSRFVSGSLHGPRGTITWP